MTSGATPATSQHRPGLQRTGVGGRKERQYTETVVVPGLPTTPTLSHLAHTLTHRYTEWRITYLQELGQCSPASRPDRTLVIAADSTTNQQTNQPNLTFPAGTPATRRRCTEQQRTGTAGRAPSGGGGRR